MSIGLRLEAGDQQQAHDLDGLILEPHADRAAGGCDGQHFGVPDRQAATIRQMDLKWLKRAGLMHLAQLLDGHTYKSILASCGRQIPPQGLQARAVAGTLHDMPRPPDYSRMELPDDRMLAIGVYGETVAAYRYTVLSERVPGEEDRRVFAVIAAEEQEHRQRLQELLDEQFPGSSFYLTDEDKAAVVAGPRVVDVRDIEDYREVMRMTLDTEKRVAMFYEAMSGRARNPAVVALFKELSEEGFDHHARLEAMARERGFLPPGS